MERAAMAGQRQSKNAILVNISLLSAYQIRKKERAHLNEWPRKFCLGPSTIHSRVF